MSDKKLQIKDFEKNNYFATQELVDVVNAALFLDKPLLIEGPAGTGKTYPVSYTHLTLPTICSV